MSEIRAMADDFDENVLADEQTAADEVVSQGLTSNQADNQTPGQMLREARLAQDYSEADLCGLTMLSKRTVQALEDDDFETLSQPVFVRGYYRKCAKVLGIDPERLLAAYAASPGTRAAPVSAPRSGPSVKVVPAHVSSGKRRPFGLILLLLILIAVALVGYAYWSDSLSRIIGDTDSGGTSISLSAAFDSDVDATDDAAPAARTTPTSILPAVLAADKKADAADGRDGADDESEVAAADNDSGGNATPIAGAADTTTTAGPDVAADTDAATPAAPATMAVAGATGADGNAQAHTGTAVASTAPTRTADATTGNDAGAAAAATALTVQFDDRSWVNIHDASGKQLLVGVYENTTRTLDGQPPYRLVIGYAPGVSVSYDGHPVKFNMAGNHTARFTVGADNG